MSFGGSAIGMINSLKNNTNLLRKRKSFKELKKETRYKPGESLKFKELSEPDLLALKAKIKNQITRERRRNILITGLLSIALLFVTGSFLKRQNENYREKQLQQKIEMKIAEEKQKKEKAALNERNILENLNKGYESLSKGEYRHAKYYFYTAKRTDKSDYRVMLAYTQAYVYDCVYNNKECERVSEMLSELRENFGPRIEVLDLFELYPQEK